MKKTYVFLGMMVFLAFFIFNIVPVTKSGVGLNTAFALTTADCKACHTDNMANAHHALAQTKGWACSYCHVVTYDPVTQVYVYQIIRDCTVCHGAATHEAAHDKTMVDSPSCLSCHVNNVVDEHVTKHGLSCDVCHKSTNQAVLNAIAKGSGPTGQTVYCIDCHGTTNHIAAHATSFFPNWMTLPGVVPGSASLWTQVTTFTVQDPATMQYQVCFKCHSYFSFGPVPNGVTNFVGSSGFNLTDQAMEFNPANRSAHPVETTLNNQTGSSSPRPLTTSQMNAPWTNVGNQKMICTSCHGANLTTNKFTLVDNRSWPKRPDTGKFWTLGDIRSNLGNWQTTLLCAKCHVLRTSLSFRNNVHGESEHHGTFTLGNTSYSGIPCVSCHPAIPHGGKRSRLIVYDSDVAPYAAYQADGTKMPLLKGFRKASSPSGYGESSCWSAAGACHDPHGSYSSSLEP